MLKSVKITGLLLLVLFISGFSSGSSCSCSATRDNHHNSLRITEKDTLLACDGLSFYKSNVSASYYADKFNGRKTASGERFDNTKYTAAHRKLPFGTMLRVTNEANGKWVDVKVNDRGPFNRSHEIDLTKKAFTDIATRKGSGHFKVKIEIIEKPE